VTAEASPQSGEAPGATEALAAFAAGLRWEALDDGVRHAARRHLLDTVGVMIAGAPGPAAERVARTVDSVGTVLIPGRREGAGLLDAALIGGTAGHGIELDDGFRQGSAHPGAAVVPSALSAACAARLDGRALLEAVVAGYETIAAVAAMCHPALRRRGFHPTAAVGPFGAAAAAGRLRGLDAEGMRDALGLAASGAAGLFAFIDGGAEVKRLHAGQAARAGLLAALLAEQGMEGPPRAIEGRDGFIQAFAGEAGPVAMPPTAPWGIARCYIKPYPCCRHLQPAFEAMVGVLAEEGIEAGEVERVEVATYAIAAAHAETGWDDFASAQLSFPYVMALGMRHRGMTLDHFSDAARADPETAALCGRLSVATDPELDARYPEARPARVTVHARGRRFTRAADEALGAPEMPLEDDGLAAKFTGLARPVLGARRADALLAALWDVENCGDVSALLEGARPA